MLKLEDVMDETGFGVSLTKLTGRKIVDIVAYIGDPLGGSDFLDLQYIVFDDGEKVWFEAGEAYLGGDYNGMNLDSDTLRALSGQGDADD